MPIATSTFLRDVILFLRNLLRTNITDPLSRTNGVGFVMTAFPKRNTQYPIITLQASGLDSRKLGMQSKANMVTITIDIRLWARNAKESDVLAQTIINVLRSNQFGSGSTDVEEIHGFELASMVPLVEEMGGDNIIHGKEMAFNYKVILS